MSDLFGTQIQVEVKVNKTSGKYSVTIIDHGERIGCAEIDSDGNSIHEKIIEYLSEQMSGKAHGDVKLTKDGERECRQEATTFNPLGEEGEEEEEGFNPLDETEDIGGLDTGYGI